MFYESIHSRLLVEKLLLKRNPLDYESYIETFRESLIDANPHQIEAIIFALEKLENGGCILADEVGLGKTIEAGLVISQFRAQRRFNILIIVPTSLAGQWNSELRNRFQISSRIITSKDKKGLKKNELPTLFQEDGVYILGREFASRLEKERVLNRKEWDLIIVDEAHEVFANIYRRFNSRSGEYNERSKENATAGNLFRLLKKTPVLLLTATPIQNNILELWGLSAYILSEGNKSQLGQYNHFKELFIQRGEITSEKIPELKERIGNFLIRNLRVSVQEFMPYRFTDRHCQTLNFNMDEEEKSLYHAVSDYLERDDIYAYSQNGLVALADGRTAGLRNLLKMSYRRALGSSFFALSNSLKGIVDRLEKMKNGGWVNLRQAVATDNEENDEEDLIAVGIDSEDDEIEERFQPNEGDLARIETEIQEVKGFIRQAQQLKAVGKDNLLIETLKNIFSDPDRFYPKTVIFTTYVATQRHLKKILEENGFQDAILLFSGSSTMSPEDKEDANKAVEVWEEEIGFTLSPVERPSGNIMERTALIHYFKTRPDKKIFISTEAGAKGLNLQFCNVVINYDLPWNPQRIEQRIGRCHRYGQERDVLVINCINADNETEQRIYNLLENKFTLFKSVLGAGDDILGTSSKAINFEFIINDILNKCRTREERLIRLQQLEEEIDEETRMLRDEKLRQTRSLLDELDPQVTMKLRNIKEKLPEFFSEYDRDMLSLVRFYARIRNLPFCLEKEDQEQIFFKLEGDQFYIGKRDEDKIREFQHISLKHPVAEKIIKEIRDKTDDLEAEIVFDYSGSSQKSTILKPYLNCRGRWDFYKGNFKGLEEEERLYDIMSIKKGEEQIFLSREEADALKTVSFSSLSERHHSSSDKYPESEKCREDRIKEDELRIQNAQQSRIDKKIHNLEVELKDMEEYLKRKESDLQEKLMGIDRKISQTFDRETGKKLIQQKGKLQKELQRTRTDLLEFQNQFDRDFNDQVLRLTEKRFLDISHEKIFTFYFEIK